MFFLIHRWAKGPPLAGSGCCGSGEPMLVETGCTYREFCDGQSLAVARDFDTHSRGRFPSGSDESCTCNVERRTFDDKVMQELKMGVIEELMARRFCLVRGTSDRDEVHMNNSRWEHSLEAFVLDQEFGSHASQHLIRPGGCGAFLNIMDPAGFLAEALNRTRFGGGWDGRSDDTRTRPRTVRICATSTLPSRGHRLPRSSPERQTEWCGDRKGPVRRYSRDCRQHKDMHTGPRRSASCGRFFKR